MTNAAEYQTPAFRAAARMVSTKSAYAWAALTPHPYAQALLGLVRSKARIQDLGFASGIYAETGLATAGYSDSNTNGVVLEAIAYLLAGRKPALTPR